MTALEQRLAGELEQLRQRVTRLEKARQQLSEQAVPNYLTTQPNGAVGALFPGGVQMIEGTSLAYNPSSSLGWIDAVTGVVREWIRGANIAGSHQVAVTTQPDATDFASVFADAAAAGAAGSAAVRVQARDNSGAAVNALVTDSLGQSEFLQVGAVAGSRLSSIGSATLTWPAASPFSNAVTVALPGAAGVVSAVASPTTNINNPAFFDFSAAILCSPNGAGGVAFQTETRGGANPGVGGIMDFAFLMWGA